MQLLFPKVTNLRNGMSIFENVKVSIFKKELKYPVPHVGWNKINLSIKKKNKS